MLLVISIYIVGYINEGRDVGGEDQASLDGVCGVFNLRFFFSVSGAILNHSMAQIFICLCCFSVLTLQGSVS